MEGREPRLDPREGVVSRLQTAQGGGLPKEDRPRSPGEEGDWGGHEPASEDRRGRHLPGGVQDQQGWQGPAGRPGVPHAPDSGGTVRAATRLSTRGGGAEGVAGEPQRPVQRLGDGPDIYGGPAGGGEHRPGETVGLPQCRMAEAHLGSEGAGGHGHIACGQVLANKASPEVAGGAASQARKPAARGEGRPAGARNGSAGVQGGPHGYSCTRTAPGDQGRVAGAGIWGDIDPDADLRHYLGRYVKVHPKQAGRVQKG